MLAAAKKDGVQEHGRVSHEELAKKMLGATVWAYPTQFEETNCITALKANAAGLKPVITDVAALAETGGPIATYIESARIYSDDYAKDKFVKSVVKALKTPLTKEELAKQKEWVEQYTWENIAKQWKGAIDG
jgi:glycosyltransferase involved in cell wall biosynthesis